MQVAALNIATSQDASPAVSDPDQNHPEGFSFLSLLPADAGINTLAQCLRGTSHKSGRERNTHETAYPPESGQSNVFATGHVSITIPPPLRNSELAEATDHHVGLMVPNTSTVIVMPPHTPASPHEEKTDFRATGASSEGTATTLSTINPQSLDAPETAESSAMDWIPTSKTNDFSPLIETPPPMRLARVGPPWMESANNIAAPTAQYSSQAPVAPPPQTTAEVPSTPLSQAKELVSQLTTTSAQIRNMLPPSSQAWPLPTQVIQRDFHSPPTPSASDNTQNHSIVDPRSDISQTAPDLTTSGSPVPPTQSTPALHEATAVGAFAPSDGNDSKDHGSSSDSHGATAKQDSLPVVTGPEHSHALTFAQASLNDAYSLPKMGEKSAPNTPQPQLASPMMEQASTLGVARALRNTLRSDLNIGIQTETFGRVTIHTATESGQLSAQLLLENSKQSALLATHLPEVERQLLRQYGLETSISMSSDNQGLFSASSSRDSNHEQHSQQRLPETGESAVILGTDSDSRSAGIEMMIANRTSGGLDVTV